MARYRLTNKAVDDLAHIWNYKQLKNGLKVKLTNASNTVDNFSEITKNPQPGKKLAQSAKDLLGLRTGRHIIFYRKTENDKIDIMNNFTKKWILNVEKRIQFHTTCGLLNAAVLVTKNNLTDKEARNKFKTADGSTKNTANCWQKL